MFMRMEASRPQRHEQGTVLIATLFAATLILSWLWVSSNYIANESNLPRQQLQLTQAASIAESGIQQFLWNITYLPSLLPSDPSYKSRTTELNTPITNQLWGGGNFTVTWTPIGNTSRYNVLSVGTASSGAQRRARAIVRIPGLVPRPYAGFGQISVSLDMGKTGSYDSRVDPVFHGFFFNGPDGDLATNGTISLTNSSWVKGDAWVAGTPPANFISVLSGSTITGVRQTMPYAYQPPLPDFSAYDTLPVLSSCDNIPPGVYKDWGAGSGLSIPGGVGCFTDGMGPVTIYVKGPLTLNGGAIYGMFKQGASYYNGARNLTIIVEPRPGHEPGTLFEDTVTLSGGTYIYSTIYAPGMNMVINGSNTFAIGSFTANQISVVSGGANSGVFYDKWFDNQPLELSSVQAPVVEAFYFE